MNGLNYLLPLEPEEPLERLPEEPDEDEPLLLLDDLLPPELYELLDLLLPEEPVE